MRYYLPLLFLWSYLQLIIENESLKIHSSRCMTSGDHFVVRVDGFSICMSFLYKNNQDPLVEHDILLALLFLEMAGEKANPKLVVVLASDAA